MCCGMMMYPFTSKDVILLMKKKLTLKVFNSIKSNFQQVESVKAIDDYTIEIIYKTIF